jgi:hypothetical protein
MELKIVTGPPSAKVSKGEALTKLRRNPQFPKNASVEIEEVEGRWVAAIVTQSGPFPPSEDGPFEAPEPSDPPEAEESPESESPSDEFGEEKPKEKSEKSEDSKEKGESGEKGLEAQVHHLVEMLTKITDALGLSDSPGDSPIPGPDASHELPPGADHNPAVPGAQGPDNKTHTVHERALKPGESPPGTTPIGAPAFSHVREDHPWKEILGKKRTFKLEEPIGDTKLADVHRELNALAEETGEYRVAQLQETVDTSGQRIARALISR